MSAEQKRCALVTGAAGGMGTAIAKALVAADHPVVLVDRDQTRLDALAKSLGGKTTTLVLDITDGPKVAALPDMIPAGFKPIDILINNAGHDIGGRKRFDVGSADDWAAIVDTNLNGLMRVTRAILPDMVARNTGDVVNMGSIAALRIVADMAPYNASKAGIHMLTDVIRATTANVATAIRRPELGTLRPGSAGDATIFTVGEGSFPYIDSTGERMTGNKRILVEGIALRGHWWHPAGNR